MLRQAAAALAATATTATGGAAAGYTNYTKAAEPIVQECPLPERARPFVDIFKAASAETGVDVRLLLAVSWQESGFNPQIVSRAGAIGLMQLMPSTAQGLGVNPWDPAENVSGGARYLATQLEAFGEIDKALGAYNAGPAAVDRYDGVPPFAETRTYVRKVVENADALTDCREFDSGPKAVEKPTMRFGAWAVHSLKRLWRGVEPAVDEQWADGLRAVDRIGERVHEGDMPATARFFDAVTGWADLPEAGSEVEIATDGPREGLSVVEGITVADSLARPLARLLADARADGVELSGWGWRSTEQQRALRIRNGCPDVHSAPASACDTPTARPGHSRHELGQAIDFTYQGRSIGSQSSPGYRWLAENAHKYGLKNLPSEPWHWSTDGK